jgi:hypothetical protein
MQRSADITIISLKNGIATQKPNIDLKAKNLLQTTAGRRKRSREKNERLRDFDNYDLSSYCLTIPFMMVTSADRCIRVVYMRLEKVSNDVTLLYDLGRIELLTSNITCTKYTDMHSICIQGTYTQGVYIIR